MFGLHPNHGFEASRHAGSALDEDLALLRRRVIQIGKCYGLLILATLTWFAFTESQNSNMHLFESFSFTKFNLPYPVISSQELFSSVNAPTPPLNVKPCDGSSNTDNAVVNHISLSRIVGRKFLLTERKSLRIIKPTHT